MLIDANIADAICRGTEPIDLSPINDAWLQANGISRAHWTDMGDRYGYSKIEVVRKQLNEPDPVWSKPLMPLHQVRRILGGASELTIVQMMLARDMPHPVRLQPALLWDTSEFYCWRWRSLEQHEAMIARKLSGNVAATHKHDAGNYQMAIRNRILEEAAARGLRLTRQITVGFKNDTGADDDLAQIRRLNEQECEEVRKLCRKLPRFILRGFMDASRGPQRSFHYCICPERHSRYGTEVRWHCHIELFLTASESRRFDTHWDRIEQRLKAFFNRYANERVISIQMSNADQGFSDYAHKDAEDNFDMMVSNLLPSCPK